MVKNEWVLCSVIAVIHGLTRGKIDLVINPTDSAKVSQVSMH